MSLATGSFSTDPQDDNGHQQNNNNMTDVTFEDVHPPPHAGAATVIEDDDDDHKISSIGNTGIRPPWYRQTWVWIAIGIVLIAMIIGISIPLAVNADGSKKAANLPADGTGQSTPYVYKPELPPSEIESNKEQFSAVLIPLYEQYGLNWELALEGKEGDDEWTPARKALEWVAGTVSYLDLTEARRIQRYALAVFYFSTYAQRHDYYNKEHELVTDMPGWTSATHWMSAAEECDWEGIECDDDNGLSKGGPRRHAVQGIFLREHSLSGILPLELAFLGNLQTLDLTSNFIYVDGQASVTPFSHMESVTHLLLEDNYVVTRDAGLPPSLEAMTNLEKISMSYNILQGPLGSNTLFTKLSQLTHLELESNFFKGDFPQVLAESKKMEYLYVRRNLMNIHLHALLEPPHLPNIFALWLDSNTISGNIPTTIGNHTELASFSITNTSLHGKIPTEMGLLSGLRRVWLSNNDLTGQVPTEIAALTELEVFNVYENKLDGQMPQGICTTIGKSDYEFKELSADCDQVKCEACCTQCHYGAN